MKVNYGNITPLIGDNKACTQLLATLLNEGHLGLLLGAGASKALKLPNWKELVLAMYDTTFPGVRPAGKIDYTNDELKVLTDEVKHQINNHRKYIDLVKDTLYHGFIPDFFKAEKDMLIAISTLIVGKKRGSIQDIISYNFDSVLEWYLGVIGLDVNVVTKEQLLVRSCDVNVTHIHGYIPFDTQLGAPTDFLVFSEKEFISRMMSNFDYWREHLLEFLRRHVFLSIGVSASSLIKDLGPYIRHLNELSEFQKIDRGSPYGIAFLPTEDNITGAEVNELASHGIIPCIFDRQNVPDAIFKIAQSALVI